MQYVLQIKKEKKLYYHKNDKNGTVLKIQNTNGKKTSADGKSLRYVKTKGKDKNNGNCLEDLW